LDTVKKIGIELKIFDEESNERLCTFHNEFDITIKQHETDGSWEIENIERNEYAYYDKGYRKEEVMVAFVLKMFGHDNNEVLNLLKELNK
jgi:hypothetical protein